MHVAGSDSVVFVVGTLAVVLSGLTGLVAARLGARANESARCHLLFYTCLGVVSATTMVCLGLGSIHWLASGATLSVMVVGATLDCGGMRQPSGF